jgi:hypothetical protein
MADPTDRPFRPFRAGDTMAIGDRVGLGCDQCDDVREGVIVGLDDYPDAIDVEASVRDMTSHLAAHGHEHTALIAAADQHFAAEDSPATITISASLADLRGYYDEGDAS